MTDSLLSSFGLYGGALVIAFIAGLFPLVSIEVFLVTIATMRTPSLQAISLMIVLAAFGHQVAKTMTYYGGERALEMPRGKTRARLERAKKYIDRWNKRPKVIMFFGATVGLPPMYLLGFIAKPLMKMEVVPFTVICFFGRIGRFAFLAAIPYLF